LKVDHEFSISGVVEDVTEIILNLKQVRFKRQIEDIDNESVTISVSGKDHQLVIFKSLFQVSKF
jgi:DNA-directed RNA polymerase subunit alpha